MIWVFSKNMKSLVSLMMISKSTNVQVAKLLHNISKQSSQHQPILLRLAVVGLEALAHPPPQHQLGTEEEFAASYAFLQSKPDLTTFLAFAIKVMLYQPAALLPRVMPSANPNPAEASRLLYVLIRPH